MPDPVTKAVLDAIADYGVRITNDQTTDARQSAGTRHANKPVAQGAETVNLNAARKP